jgi:hypothetical protein
LFDLDKHRIVPICYPPHLCKLHAIVDVCLEINKSRRVRAIETSSLFYRASCVQLCNLNLLV